MTDDSERALGQGERVIIRTEPAGRTMGGSRTAGGVRQSSDDLDYRAVSEQVGPRRDRVHWGPIWAGLLTALTSLLLLGLLGLATGVTTVNAGVAAAQGGPPA